MSQSSNNKFIFSIFAVAAALALIAIIEVTILSLLYGSVSSNQVSNMAANLNSIEERIKPVVTLADIRGGNTTKAAAPVVAKNKSAKDLYNDTCMACHANAVAGAPKPGDKAAWEGRYAKGFDALFVSVKNGKGAMPAKGGSTYSDAELTKIIEYMLIESDVMDAKAMDAKTDVMETVVKPVKAAMKEAVVAVKEMVAEVKQKTSDVDLAAGEKAYRSSCFACHDFAVAGAPKLGDVAAWESRKGLSLDTLVANAINGKGGMPPKGGSAFLSDAEIKNIVAFMLSKI